MKCRSLVQNEITKKQNVVWFGSYGKNNNYIPQAFPLKDKDGNPIIVEDGIQKAWRVEYMNYYVATVGPAQNSSSQWQRQPILPSDELFPSDLLFLNSGTEITYLRFENGEYVPVEEVPLDWKENYSSYYIAIFTKNEDAVFDPNITYYAHNNKLSAKNYSEKGQGVRASLIQRLSVIKGELWYKASYGLPLTEKIKNKGIYDSIVINIITTHPDVANLDYYDSYVVSKSSEGKGEFKPGTYVFEFKATTIYNEELAIRYTI